MSNGPLWGVIAISLHKETKIILIVINQVAETLLVYKLYFRGFSLESHYPKPDFCYPNFRPHFGHPNFKQGVIPLSQTFPRYPIIPNSPFRALEVIRPVYTKFAGHAGQVRR